MSRAAFLVLAACTMLASASFSAPAAHAAGSVSLGSAIASPSFNTSAGRLPADIAGITVADHTAPLAGSGHSTLSSGSLFGLAYGMRPGNAFAAGLLGGLLGAGVGGMLDGDGFFAAMHGGPGVLGVLLQLIILYLIAGWLYRRLTENLSPVGGLYGRVLYAGPGAASGARLLQGVARPGLFGGGRTGRPISLSPADYQSFEEVLHCVQAAWSMQDVTALRSLGTPEMAAAFATQLNDQANRGRRNQISAVRLHDSTLSDAWAEGNRDFATVQLRYSMLDVTLDSVGRVLDGSATEHVTVTEIWTFLREKRARWVVANIQDPK
jgi:predicted lipid-binding transport protein (Tim44 family)